MRTAGQQQGCEGGNLSQVWLPPHILHKHILRNAGIVGGIALLDVDHGLHDGHKALAPRVQAIDDRLQGTQSAW